MLSKSKQKQGAFQAEVSAGQADRRVDNFLFSLLGDVPRARVYRMIRSGEVRVDGRRVRQDYRVQEGQRVRIPPLTREPRPPSPEVPRTLLDRLAGSVLFENDRLMVLNKPAGIPVHSDSGRSHGVIEILRRLRPTETELQLVHRLDRETSGCLMIARDSRALRELHDLLRKDAVKKYYLALLKGYLRGVRRVDLPLRRNLLRGGERIAAVTDGGREAFSEFKAQRNGEDWSLARVRLGSGRTHQIRVHAAAIGHPVAGDSKYGDREFNRSMRKRGLHGMFLHASELHIRDAPRHLKLHVQAPLPGPYREFLDRHGG